MTPELMKRKDGEATPNSSGNMPPLRPAPMMHYDVPESPKRKSPQDEEAAGAGSSAIYEEIEDDVSGGIGSN